MSKFSTGEIAKLCGISVRAVQFYDKQGLLKPQEKSEGGRRLYSKEDLKILRTICLYKDLGLSLSQIKNVLHSGEGELLLSATVREREKVLSEEIEQKKKQLKNVKLLKEYLNAGGELSTEGYFDAKKTMKGKKKLKATYITMLTIGILLDLAQIAFIVLWAVKGIWLPFAIGMPLVVLAMIALVVMYYKNTAYVCSNCNKKFKSKVKEWFFAMHTPKTRKLTCPYCNVKAYHLETYSDEE